MPKLTDTQLMLLSKAAQGGGLIFLPPKLQGAAAAKVVNPLLKNGLVQEVVSQPDTGAWRRDEATGEYRGLLITDAGRAAINVEGEGKPKEKKPAQAQTISTEDFFSAPLSCPQMAAGVSVEGLPLWWRRQGRCRCREDMG